MPSEFLSIEIYQRDYPTLYNVLEFIWDYKMFSELYVLYPRNYPALCDTISTKRHELYPRSYPALKYAVWLFVEMYVFELSDIFLYLLNYAHSKMASELSDTLFIARTIIRPVFNKSLILFRIKFSITRMIYLYISFFIYVDAVLGDGLPSRNVIKSISAVPDGDTMAIKSVISVSITVQQIQT